jgi:predicted lipoprotein with Yx(FWY)xxD motif
MSRVATWLVVGAAVVVAIAVGVVLTQRSSSPAGAGEARAGQAAGAPDVRVGRGRLGRMLVDARGRTLYLFLQDAHGRSACTGRCAKVWPPAIVAGRPRGADGARTALLSTTRRPDGRRQLVYRGHPLYRMSADARPGDMTGQGFLGTWFVVSPAGHRLGKAPAGGEGY